MDYTVVFSRAAERQLRALPREVQQQLAPRLDALARDPRPRGAKKLKGEEGFYRVRSGDYRVIYSIDEASREIIVLSIGDRKEIYRRR